LTEEEFDDFYTGSVGNLVGQLYAMTGDLAEAQDVVQEAFLRAWQRRRQLSVDDAPVAWVRTVAWRLAVSRWRRVRGSAVAWRRRGSGAPVATPSTDRMALVEALRRIPEAQRVAVETGVPTGTVKARLSRGRHALAPYLDDCDDLEVSGA
jgi:RNA polymerase sigma-70 factor, ECF subfamily